MAVNFLFCVPLQRFQPTLARCSPQSTAWKSSSHTSRHWLCTGQHTRSTHSVPSARAAMPGLHARSPATSMQPITTTRTWIWDGAPYYKSQILVSVKVHNHNRLSDIAVALESPHMLLVKLEALIKAVLLCRSSFLFVSCRIREQAIWEIKRN